MSATHSDMGVGNIRIDEENPNWIVIESIVPPDVGGFMIREVGLLDDEGDLLVIAKYPETYKPTVNDGTIKDLIIRVVIEIANTDSIAIKIDPTIVLATKREIIDVENKIDTILQQLTEKTNQTAKNADKLDNLDSTDFVRSMNFSNSQIPKEIFDNHAHTNSYIGTINYGKQVGLIENYAKIIYIANNTDGFGTQIAIPYVNNSFITMYIRNSDINTWTSWSDMRSLGNAESNPYRNTDNCNTAIESGKLYYCIAYQCQNMPHNALDGILLPLMHRTDIAFGMQIFMTWNNDSVWIRHIHTGQFKDWQCISGGNYNSEVQKDSKQISKYLRWEQFGQNHIIFDASSGTMPNGQPCDRVKPKHEWIAGYPNIMGFNGQDTYPLRVDIARNAEQIQGFQFRNNNGQLEILINGAWLSVGAKQYTVVRQGILTNGQRFEYSGGSGIIRSIKVFNNSNYQSIIVDGTLIDIRSFLYIDSYRYIEGVEFKNSISILSKDNELFYIIQTEK